MDIFRRKRLAAAEEEIRGLKKDSHQQYIEYQALSEKLRVAENEVQKYIHKHDVDMETIDKLKREKSKLNATCQSLAARLDANKSNYSAYDNSGSQHNQELNNANKEIEELKKKLARADERNAELSSILEREDGEIEGSKTNSVSPIWVIQDEVRNNPAYVREVYRNKSVFFTPNEAKFYELLLPLVQNKGLFLFSKVRLVDIVGLSSEFYDKKAKEKAKEKNPKEDGTVFLDNPYKKDVMECIQKNKPDFNHYDYKRIFLFPLLRLHIDFLVCKKADGKFKPILALELNGEEHDIESQNDGFKKTLFYSNKRNQIGFLKVKNKTLDNSSELKKTFEDILNDVVNDTAKDKWKEFQKTLNYLAE